MSDENPVVTFQCADCKTEVVLDMRPCPNCDGALIPTEADALRSELAALTRKLAEMESRYTWAANELLACDYGDNDQPGEQVGWHVYGWRNRDGKRPRRIFGPSIDAAIDAELRK